jgi:hypothetical protein
MSTNYIYIDSYNGSFMTYTIDTLYGNPPSHWILLLDSNEDPYQILPSDTYQEYWNFTHERWQYKKEVLAYAAGALLIYDDQNYIFTWNAHNYVMSEFLQPYWAHIFAQAARENGADTRGVYFMDNTSALLTNTQILNLCDACSNALQATRDIFHAAINEINADTIYTIDQLNTYWADARANYNITRSFVPNNESLNDNKVDKVIGKGLSTEDYTTDEKIKLAGL